MLTYYNSVKKNIYIYACVGVWVYREKNKNFIFIDFILETF